MAGWDFPGRGARERPAAPQGAPLPGRPPGKLPRFSPGLVGVNDQAAVLAKGTAVAPLRIHLDLAELVELNEVLEHARSGLIARGPAFNKDAKRPRTILALVQKLFGALGRAVEIGLGNGTKSDRFLKAAFAWGNDPDVGGVSAQGYTRTRLGNFNCRGADQSLPVTGYVFEGVIGNWIVNYLGAKPINVDNLFAAVVAHELGHQLGLRHEKTSSDLMFVFSGRPRAEQVAWLEAAHRGRLGFSKTQVATMRSLLAKP